MTQNFSYLIPGKLAGSAMPGRFGRLDDDLTALARRRIRAVVSLTEDGLDARTLARHGLEGLHLPVRDFTAPSQEQLRVFGEYVDARLDEDKPVLVHCGAGMGRTGVMLAAYLIHRGAGPGEAIRAVRRARPGSIETAEQEECLFAFSARRDQSE